jgi:hypothetical protein
MPEKLQRPGPRDPRLCSLPHCPNLANGHDWMLGWKSAGDPFLMGFCSQVHLAIGRDLMGYPPLPGIGWIVESDPMDNFEDRVRMGLRGDALWAPALLQHAPPVPPPARSGPAGILQRQRQRLGSGTLFALRELGYPSQRYHQALAGGEVRMPSALVQGLSGGRYARRRNVA